MRYRAAGPLASSTSEVTINRTTTTLFFKLVYFSEFIITELGHLPADTTAKWHLEILNDDRGVIIVDNV